MPRVNGLHHITAIAGPAQENLDFYAGVLGMRLVKRSVNQDDPGTYHLFYADAEGHPGTDLTFFPWTGAAPPRAGYGLAMGTSLEVPAGSLEAWASRLGRYGVAVSAIDTRFGDRALPFIDPHGLPLALVESGRPIARPFTPWDESPVPAGQQILGLYGAQVWERRAADTVAFVMTALGFSELARDGDVVRYGIEGAPGVLDVVEKPDAPRGAWGTGCVHHLAWRVDDEHHQLAVRRQVASAGGRATEVIDRFWFKSVYFREPGGVLFEIATDGPGFAADENPRHLGESLVLPPWLETSRPAIERALPALSEPRPAVNPR
jgi:glyoxalase family protein